MTLKKYFSQTLRILPVALVALVIMCGGIWTSQRNSGAHSAHHSVHQGRLIPINAIYAILEGKELLKETEDEESQQLSDFKTFKSWQAIPNSDLNATHFSYYTAYVRSKHKSFQLVGALYEIYCQLKIDC